MKYGSYPFEINSIVLEANTEPVWNDGGQWISQRRIIDWKGSLLGDGQSDLTQKINALINAMQVPGQDLIFYQDDGSPSAHLLRNAGSITGVRITMGPKFPMTMGGEYSTYRYFEFRAEAEYPFTAASSALRSFTETLTFSGGGPRYIHKEALEGPAQKQRPCAQTAFMVVQEGEAVGYLRKPIIPAPIWPMALKVAPTITPTAPKRQGQGYTDYSIRWQYVFEANYPLIGEPTLWVA